MKIESSNITMTSQRNYVEEYQRTEKLKIWSSKSITDETKDEQQQKGCILEISDEAKQKAVELKSASIKEAEKTEISISKEDKFKAKLVEKFVEIFTGAKIKMAFPKVPRGVARGYHRNHEQQNQTQKFEMGVKYSVKEKYYEKEQTSFSAEGVVKTADGKEMDIEVNLNMSREFVQHNNVNLKEDNNSNVNPLVVNYDGPAADLTTTKYDFDIDCDGSKDQISFTTNGSGFLALDSNGDGKINDGSELIGTNGEGGFKELSQYDQDGNGWIDEGDSIYENLRIWTKDQDGNDKLFALGEKDIGAIYLGNIETMFDVKNINNKLKGEIQNTGIFLKEEGTAGTIQRVNLTV